MDPFVVDVPLQLKRAYINCFCDRALQQCCSQDGETRTHHQAARRRSVFLVRKPSNWKYFEDWLRPFIYTLEVHTTVHVIDFKNEKQLKVALLEKSVPGDVVLMVQRPFMSPQDIPHRDVWLVNTEGLDKARLYAEAHKKGFSQVIDYSLANAPEFQERGFARVLWLPIIAAPGVVVPAQSRNRLCHIGDLSTPARKKLWGELQSAALLQNMSVPFEFISKWRASRDVVAQRCRLVINSRSRDVNKAMPRLRVDILTLYGIPVISESMSPLDEREYGGVVKFVARKELVNATLKYWSSLEGGSNDHAARLKLKQRREQQFLRCLREILGTESTIMSKIDSIANP